MLYSKFKGIALFHIFWHFPKPKVSMTLTYTFSIIGLYRLLTDDACRKVFYQSHYDCLHSCTKTCLLDYFVFYTNNYGQIFLDTLYSDLSGVEVCSSLIILCKNISLRCLEKLWVYFKVALNIFTLLTFVFDTTRELLEKQNIITLVDRKEYSQKMIDV